MENNIYSYTVKDADGKSFQLSSLRGQVVLIVNTASRCGFTPQYAGLQKLYDTYREKGFTVIGFPCDQFMHQEPGDMKEIKSFCSLKYNVTFPLMNKINVNGKNTEPLYSFLKAKAHGFILKSVKWNFTKFLIDREGNVFKRFSPSTPPENLSGVIEKLL